MTDGIRCGNIFSCMSQPFAYTQFSTNWKTEGLQRIGFKGMGCVDPDSACPLTLGEDGLLGLQRDTFDPIDTIMLQDNQVHKVAFLKPDKSPYLTVTFDAPVVAIWSPPKRNAPFFCIEPWYGRCSRCHFLRFLRHPHAVIPGADLLKRFNIKESDINRFLCFYFQS